jgi:hypothetical protein
VKDYFDESLAMLNEVSALQARPVNRADDAEYLTNFERKYRQEGRPIYRALYERGGLV